METSQPNGARRKAVFHREIVVGIVTHPAGFPGLPVRARSIRQGRIDAGRPACFNKTGELRLLETIIEGKRNPVGERVPGRVEGTAETLDTAIGVPVFAVAVVEDRPARANDGLGCSVIRQAQARTESVLSLILKRFPAAAPRAVAGELKSDE